MKSAQVVKQALDKMQEAIFSGDEKKKGEAFQAWLKAMTKLVPELCARLEPLEQTNAVMNKVLQSAAARAKGAAAAPQAAAEVAAPPPAQSGGIRMGADGSPLSPEQAAIEDQMDQAMGIAEPSPAPAVRSAAPARRPRPAGKIPGPPVAQTPAPVTGRIRMGADGSPLSPEQSAIEDQMDQAIGIPPGQG